MSVLYTEYEIIQKHMYFSRKLYEINALGKHLIEEIDSKKCFRGPRGGCKILHEPTQHIRDSISNIVKPYVLYNNIYSSLVFFLDELLFLQVQNINSFQIDDDIYPLSFMYFNQDEWIKDWCLQEFTIDECPIMTEFDSLMLIIFIETYEEFAIEIMDYIVRIRPECQDKRLRRKIIKLITRLKQRVGTLMYRALRVYYKTFEKKN